MADTSADFAALSFPQACRLSQSLADRTDAIQLRIDRASKELRDEENKLKRLLSLIKQLWNEGDPRTVFAQAEKAAERVQLVAAYVDPAATVDFLLGQQAAKAHKGPVALS